MDSSRRTTPQSPSSKEWHPHILCMSLRVKKKNTLLCLRLQISPKTRKRIWSATQIKAVGKEFVLLQSGAARKRTSAPTDRQQGKMCTFFFFFFFCPGVTCLRPLQLIGSGGKGMHKDEVTTE
ncbi:hypothetical protein CEXT_525661 [Caerostris extrusa]|uniref:Uncharacterized protein n=1 Tax=Caerostris extrusa TaxID=172846 RepID=A0AAV4MQY7_CAEEX|nr:hypothetical protein CEXT_525661 [Caerostris extrusa]